MPIHYDCYRLCRNIIGIEPSCQPQIVVCVGKTFSTKNKPTPSVVFEYHRQ